MEQVLIVFCNFPASFDVAGVAQQIVTRRLAACANLLPAVQSYFRWEGALESATEATLMIKTTVTAYPGLQAALIAAHPYDVPEIIAIPIAAGLPAYLDWVRGETRKDVNV